MSSKNAVILRKAQAYGPIVKRPYESRTVISSAEIFLKSDRRRSKCADLVDYQRVPRHGMAPSAVTTLFDATIPSVSLRPFSRILVGLSRIGDELCFEASSSKVRIRNTV